MEELNDLIQTIQTVDAEAIEAARARQDTLTKPAGSLGRLEALSILAAGVQRSMLPKIEHKAVVVMAGDHGVVAEGVSAFPQEVTPQMVFNFLAGGAAINVLARHEGVDVRVVDMGVAADLPAHPQLIDKKVRKGTDNIAQGPAMSPEEALAAILAGVQVVEDLMSETDYDIIATGDMGIGNTTPSAALAVAFTGLTPEEIVGRGTGVDDAGYQRKLKAVKQALAVNQPNPKDGLEMLARIGGFEIGGIAGVVLGAAAHGCVVAVDGFISTAGAMIAATLCPAVRGYLVSGHASQELGHQRMLAWLGLEPILDLNLRLGEGTGAVLAIGLVEASCKILSEMATFSEAGVSDKEGESEIV
jgi:nicotinate-nucleotide--dimethylbenzimidazole phosphoribosyltransferase